MSVLFPAIADGVRAGCDVLVHDGRQLHDARHAETYFLSPKGVTRGGLWVLRPPV